MDVAEVDVLEPVADRADVTGSASWSADLLPAVADRLSAAEGGVALIAAPGGYGKSRQLEAWVVGDGRPVAWLDLDPTHDDADTLRAAIAMLLGAPTRVLAAAGTGDAPRTAEPVPPGTIVVLDDVHHVTSAEGLRLLEGFAMGIPTSSTLVLAGRSVPSMPLGRLRAGPGLVELGAASLALDEHAADRLLRSLGASIDRRAVASVVARTEGWPVGVLLAGIALVHDRDAPPPTGEDRYIADLLHREWLGGLDADDTAFLMAAACLEQFDGPLCDSVLDGAASGRRLARLEAAGLVVPVEGRRRTFRLHHLLRELLLADLRSEGADLAVHVHRRASTWFAAQGDVATAIHHAERAGDHDAVGALLVDHESTLVADGDDRTIHHALASLPAARVAKQPSLCIVAARATLARGETETCARWLRTLDSATGADGPSADVASLGDDPLALRAALLRANVGTGTLAELLRDATVAYEGLPPDLWHAEACQTLGGLLLAKGATEQAVAVLGEGVAGARLAEASQLEVSCLAHLALALDADDPDRAAATARHARSLAEARRIVHTPATAIVTAASALFDARRGAVQAARKDWLYAHNLLDRFDPRHAWATVLPRQVLARAAPLLGDHRAARTLLQGLVRHRCIDDAPWLRAQLDELRDVERIAETENVASVRLSGAELCVLHRLPTYLSLADIAEQLYVSRNTTKSHVAAIYRKLGVGSRADAVERARELGMLPTAAETAPASRS